MITIKVDGTKDAGMLLIEYADQIREHAINAIEESFDLGLDEAICVEFEIHAGDEVEYRDMALRREVWMDFLAKSIERLLELEDYGTLIKVRELMRKISENEDSI